MTNNRQITISKNQTIFLWHCFGFGIYLSLDFCNLAFPIFPYQGTWFFIKIQSFIFLFNLSAIFAVLY